nr:hypothetical protein [Tanacetum cinerariifolium]
MPTLHDVIIMDDDLTDDDVIILDDDDDDDVTVDAKITKKEIDEILEGLRQLAVKTKEQLPSTSNVVEQTIVPTKMTAGIIGRYGVYVPALTKDHEGNKIQYAISRRRQFAIFKLYAIQAQLNNLGREIEKVNEKVYVAQVECKQCKGSYYTKDYPLKEEGKTLEEAYCT